MAGKKAVREGRLDIGSGAHTPQTAMNLAGELAALRKQLKEQDKEIRRLKQETMKEILAEDECNDTYGRIRMYQALLLKQPEGIHVPGERTVYRVMEEIGISHRPKRKPNGIAKADREARKSDDLLKRDFKSAEPLKKCVTDMTEIKAKDGKLYVSAILDCYDSGVPGLAMDTTSARA